jgi:hypothetical protein
MKRASFFQAKVAFEIPGHYQRDGIYGPKYDDRLIDRLMDLFPDCEFESENLCSPALLVVNTSTPPTPSWIKKSVARINEVLCNQ